MSTITRGNVGAYTTGSITTTVTSSWVSPPTAGQTVLCFVQCGASPASQMAVPLRVADNGSPSTIFSEVCHVGSKPNVTSSGYRGAYLFRGDNVQPSGAYSITLTTDLAQNCGLGGVAYSNLGSLAEWQQGLSSSAGTVARTGFVDAPLPSGSVLFFGGFSNNSSNASQSQTLNSASFTDRGHNVNGTVVCGGCADAITSDGVAQSLQWTFGDSVTWEVVLAAFHDSDASTRDTALLPNSCLRPSIWTPGNTR